MSRRAGFVALLVVAVLVAIVAGNATAARPAAVRSTDSASEVLPSVAASTLWFCPGMPPAIKGSDARVTLSNVGDAPADLVVTVLPDKGASTRQTLTVAASTVLSKRRADLGPPGALTVETFGGMVVAEEGFDGRAGTDMTPCATQSATEWHFAAGSTLRGMQVWLVVDDPYASDAKIDISLRTNAGLRRPEHLQGFDIPRRSRVVIPIHEYAVRNDRVAIEVNASIGRVVAAETLVYSADAGTPGVATTIGAPVASDQWTFAAGEVVNGSSSWVAIANDGTDDAQVAVQALPTTSTPVPPATITVGRDDVEWVQLGNCKAGAQDCVALPDGASYGLDVHSDQGVPIVAQTLTRFSSEGAQSGVTTAMGQTTPGTKFAFATSVVAGEQATTLAVVNPFAQPVHVSVTRVHDGTSGLPESLQSVEVLPGRRVTLVVVSSKAPSRDTALLVDATGPVVVERTMVGDHDVSRSPGIRLP